MNGKTVFRRYGQFIKFNLVGLLNTFVDFVIYTLLVTVGLFYVPAQCISYAAGMGNSFLMNKYWTFSERKTEAHGRQLFRFIVLNAATLGLALLVLYALDKGLGLHPVVSKIFATGLTMLVNFAGSKFWVYKAE